MEKYKLYITIGLILITILPIMYVGARIFSKDGRGEFIDRPLLFIYTLIAPLYFYAFWARPDILEDYLDLQALGQIIVYCVLCFAVILKTEPPE